MSKRVFGFPDYHVYEQITPPTDWPFRIIEMYMSCDGPRSRLTSSQYRTREEAIARREELFNALPKLAQSR